MEIQNIPMMKIRQHRGGLAESLATQKEIPASLAAVREFISEIHVHLPLSQEELDTVRVKPYFPDHDNRCGWEKTFLIIYVPRDSEACAVFGMCSSMVEQ